MDDAIHLHDFGGLKMFPSLKLTASLPLQIDGLEDDSSPFGAWPIFGGRTNC